MAKRKKCPEFENHERWLVAFADMMTLLFALFVVLYALSMSNISKIKQVAESIQVAFGVRDEIPVDDGNMTLGPANVQSIMRFIKGNTSREQILKRMSQERVALIDLQTKKLEQKLAERLYGAKQFPDSAKPPQDRVVYVERDPDGIRITLLARKFFLPGSVALEEDAKKILDGIGDALRNLNRVVRIEGHTDNLPFSKEGMSNWELSALRAVAATRFLLETHPYLKGSLYAAGFADTKPLAVNDTPEDRALNRRIDIKILYDQASDYIPPDDTLGFEKYSKE